MKLDRATELAKQNGWTIEWDETFKLYILKPSTNKIMSEHLNAAELALMTEEEFLAQFPVG